VYLCISWFNSAPPRLCGKKHLTSKVIAGRMPALPVSPGEAGIRLFGSLRLLAANFLIGTLRKPVDGFPWEAYKCERFDGLE
jgi:hypothetical protein